VIDLRIAVFTDDSSLHRNETGMYGNQQLAFTRRKQLRRQPPTNNRWPNTRNKNKNHQSIRYAVRTERSIHRCSEFESVHDCGGRVTLATLREPIVVRADNALASFRKCVLVRSYTARKIYSAFVIVTILNRARPSVVVLDAFVCPGKKQ
jgi:hypothetical protein